MIFVVCEVQDRRCTQVVMPDLDDEDDLVESSARWRWASNCEALGCEFCCVLW